VFYSVYSLHYISSSFCTKDASRNFLEKRLQEEIYLSGRSMSWEVISAGRDVKKPRIQREG
jgi:hypothetical protein